MSDIPVTGVSLDANNINIEKGSSKTVVATIIPSNATNKNVTWSSSNNSIATVNNGVITAISAGTCMITVTTVDGGYTASCTVNSLVYPTSISFNMTEISHIINESRIEDLQVSFEPSDCNVKDLIWDSTDPSIATYDVILNSLRYDGDVGECNLIAIDASGDQASCNIKVYKRKNKPDPPNISQIELNSITLEGIVDGEYSINDSQIWQSETRFKNLEINTMYSFTQRRKRSGYYLESNSSNTTQVRTKDIVHVSSVKLNVHELSLTIEDDSISYQFETTVLPVDAYDKEIQYSLNNTEVGYINNDGKFIATYPGEVTVTVKSVDGEKTDSCVVKVYRKWQKPDPPIITSITKKSVTVATKNNTVYSIDHGKTWTNENIFAGLRSNATYRIICKLISVGYMLESDVSNQTVVVIPVTDPKPNTQRSRSILLSASELSFDINKNTYATLNYIIEPNVVVNKNVYWYTTDDSIMSINDGGEICAINVGSCDIYVKTIDSGVTDSCKCKVYKVYERPDPPVLDKVTLDSIKLVEKENCEYSIDGEIWQSSVLFEGLTKDTYYTLYQRIKATGDYQPPSEASYGLTVKTLTDEKPGGESESGYTWAQEVEVNNIPVYGSPYAKKPDTTVTGKYYIFNLMECNHRIRLTYSEEYAGVYGHSTGWVNITDLKLIESEIYVGDKVIVDGDINIYADGSGTFIHKTKAEMYVTDIIESLEYSYGVTSKPGFARQAFAKPDQVTKYKTIVIND